MIVDLGLLAQAGALIVAAILAAFVLAIARIAVALIWDRR